MADPKDPPPTDADKPTEPPPPFRPRLDLIGDADRGQRAATEERRSMRRKRRKPKGS